MFADIDWTLVLTAVRDLGFPIVAYGLLALAIWKVIVWVGTELIIPMRDAFTGFLGSIRSNLETQTVALQEMQGSLKTLVAQGCAHGEIIAARPPLHPSRNSET